VRRKTILERVLSILETRSKEPNNLLEYSVDKAAHRANGHASLSKASNYACDTPEHHNLMMAYHMHMYEHHLPINNGDAENDDAALYHKMGHRHHERMRLKYNK
jgi:hypothetical protein